MFWYWYNVQKRMAAHRHAMVGMNPTMHKLLMRMFYPL